MNSDRWRSFRRLIKPQLGIFTLLVLVAGLAFGVAGCAFSPAAAPASTGSPTVAPQVPSEEGTIRAPLRVLKAPDGSTLALVPVTINGQGPFNFALDTGASKSVINTPVATQLGLQVVGSAGQVTGVTGSVSANLVRVPNWKAGTVSLTPSDIIELDLGGATGNVGLQGLLGSDVLSAYGAITVDYDHQVLILTPH